jgi:hypothetical protein
MMMLDVMKEFGQTAKEYLDIGVIVDIVLSEKGECFLVGLVCTGRFKIGE